MWSGSSWTLRTGTSKNWEGPWETLVHRVSLEQQVALAKNKRDMICTVTRNCLMSEVYHSLCYRQRDQLLERRQKITLMICKLWIRVRDLPSVNMHSQSIIYRKMKSFQKFKRWWGSPSSNWIHQTMGNPSLSQNREVKMIIQKHSWRKCKQAKINQNFHSTFKTHPMITSMTIFWINDLREDSYKSLQYP